MQKEKIIRRTEDVVNAVSDMRQAMERTPERISESKIRMTEFQKKHPNVTYLEPVHKIPTQGNKHPHFEKQREHLTEYVTGVFESEMIQGKLDFWLTGLPGDDYCNWVIPVNKPVGVPRFVAQHLAKGLGWKEMKPLGRGNEPQAFYEEEMTRPFEQFVYKKRGHFRALNEF